MNAARATGSVSAGVLAALIAAVVGSMLGAVSLLVITFTFMDTIRHNTFMIQDFVRSGMTDMDAFIVEDALGAIFFGTLFSLVLSAALGTLGGWLGRAYAR